MIQIKYPKIEEVDPVEFLPLLNNQATREHLVEHSLFDVGMVAEWIRGKVLVDSSAGCKVRAIEVNNRLAGWCGIQQEDGKYEIAIVIDPRNWGIGKSIFRELMAWARDLGHTTIFIHLLHTRPEYKFLRKLAKSVRESEILGSEFVSYELEVN